MAFPSTRAVPSHASDLQLIRSGARWLYLVAGLTVAGALLALADSGLTLLFGLNTPTVAVYFAMGTGMLVFTVVAMVITALFAAGFAVLAFNAGKVRGWAFLAAAGLYALDTVWSVVFQDWLAVLAHGILLYILVTAARAVKRVQGAGMQSPTDDTPPSVATAPPLPLTGGSQGFAEAKAPAPLD